MNIFQHVVEFNSHDGIGNDIRGIQELAEKEGIQAKIFTNKNNTNLPSFEVLNSKDLRRINFKADNYHIFHFGSAGYPIREFRNLPGKKIFRFHNITPYEFNYLFCSNEIFKVLKRAYQQAIMEIRSIVFDMDEYWFDSTFNLDTFNSFLNNDLLNKKKIVVPIFRKYDYISNNSITQNKIELLYTGRIVPHKKIEDILFILYYLLKFNFSFKLNIVGKQSPLFSEYKKYLDSLIHQLKLIEFIEWYEDISEDELLEIRKKSHFYISMSEHEGFCIPILESFAAGIPVLAYNAGSVSETMRNGGILINQKNHLQIAALIDTLSKRFEVLKQIQSKQLEVLNYFNQNRSLLDILK